MTCRSALMFLPAPQWLVGGLLALTLLVPSGCRKRTPSQVASGPHPSTVAKWTYYCTETKTWVQAPPQGPPAINPQTGRKTLGLALYCPECKKWHPVPPPPVHPGNPLGFQCPRHKIAMQVEGPPPENTP